MTEVAIVGLGPWGLSALERLLDGIKQDAPGRGFKVHVVEPGRPGSGAFRVDEPDYFILNTPCGQHLLHPYPETAERLGFFEWVSMKGYSWVGDRCQVTTLGRPITRKDYLPRRLMGEYLEWFYNDLVETAPEGVEVVHHAAAAEAIVSAHGREHIRLSDGEWIDADYVMLATGHTENTTGGSPVWATAIPPYPYQGYANTLCPGSAVLVSGLGLVALDVVIALTRGRGGRFVEEAGTNRLRYVPSGNEPAIYMFSRSGAPYRAKSAHGEDPIGSYHPTICTYAAIDAVRARRARESGTSQIDARNDLLPLVFAEMQVRFYEQSARLDDGDEAAEAVAGDLTASWYSGDFAATLATYANKYGDFDAAAEFFEEGSVVTTSPEAYEAGVYAAIDDDLSEALAARGPSPRKAAHEVLRVLRDTMRETIEFRKLTFESYLDFQGDVRGHVNRLVTGPPAFRCQQLLALMDAGVVQLPFGPAPSIERLESGYLVSSRHLDEPVSRRVDGFIRGHLDDPTCDRSASPLLRSLFERGRIRQFSYDGEGVGSIDLSEDLHPYNSDGDVEHRLFVLGAPSEGVRYFTAYIPSPKSRIRAFLDAQACVEQILSFGL